MMKMSKDFEKRRKDAEKAGDKTKPGDKDKKGPPGAGGPAKGGPWGHGQWTDAQKTEFHNKLLASIPADKRAEFHNFLQLMPSYMHALQNRAAQRHHDAAIRSSLKRRGAMA